MHHGTRKLCYRKDDRTSGSNGAISSSNKFKMAAALDGGGAAAAILIKFQMVHGVFAPQPVVRSTSCFVLGWGFRGRRI